jgi:hypothetical protein
VRQHMYNKKYCALESNEWGRVDATAHMTVYF